MTRYVVTGLHATPAEHARAVLDSYGRPHIAHRIKSESREAVLTRLWATEYERRWYATEREAQFIADAQSQNGIADKHVLPITRTDLDDALSAYIPPTPPKEQP